MLLKRRNFLATASAATVLAANGLPNSGAAAETARAGRRALVLSGGGSLGAYQAGVIAGLVQRAGLRDGEPLNFDMVCGTSIGALNSYFIATAQYSKLGTLWKNVVGSSDVIQIKPQFRSLRNPSAGVANRVDAAIRLGRGLVKGLKGLLDPAAFEALLEEHVDPAAPVHIPFYIATTNLTRQEGRLFVRRATTANGMRKQALNDELDTNDLVTKVRIADDGLLRSALRASAAIPLAFDPVLIPRSDGSAVDEYVDGGVTDNVPINLARRCVEDLHVILVDPPRMPVDATYDGAVQIGLGVFETMQRRILEYQVLWAMAQGTHALPFKAYLIRPAQPLPGKFIDFNDTSKLNAMWQVGYSDASRGWQPFVPPTD